MDKSDTEKTEDKKLKAKINRENVKSKKMQLAIDNSPCNTAEEFEFKNKFMNLSNLPGLGILPIGIGTHVHGHTQLSESIETYSNIPIQAFISHYGKFPDYNIEHLKNRIIQQNLTAFCHLPYFINLCCPKTSKFPNELESLNVIVREIALAESLGFKGCVIHVGKNIPKLGYTKEQAWHWMKYYTLWLLCNINNSCPLLLETPASQGTEMLGEIMDFIKFYKDVVTEYPEFYQAHKNQINSASTELLPEQIQQLTNNIPFGICVDTCHVFQSDYYPIDYLVTIESELGPGVVKLIHFNDSLEPKGSKLDRHFHVPFGHIGATNLLPVYNWANTFNIPMVIE